MNNYSKLLQHELLSKETTYDLIREYQSSEDSLVKSMKADKLIKSNFKFIYKLSTNFYHNHRDLELDEYIQVGCEAMLRTLDKFDLNSGYALLTYYTAWHYSFCQRYWTKHKGVVRVPNHVLELARLIRKAQAQYERLHGVSPSIAQVAEQLEITPEKVKETLLAIRPIGSLNKETFNEDNNSTELLDIISDHEQYSPDEYLSSVIQTETIETLLSVLSDRDREIIKMRYGINQDCKVYTLGAIGDIFNISRERCRQVITSSIRKLKQSGEINNLKQFI